MKMTMAEKKVWLERYHDAMIAEEEIKMEIEAIESKYMIPARRMDGMPRSGNGSDLADMAATVDPLLNELEEQRKAQVKIHREIVNVIEHSPISKRQRSILRYRYIMCLKWEEIEDRMHMDRTWMHRLREDAIGKLKIRK